MDQEHDVGESNIIDDIYSSQQYSKFDTICLGLTQSVATIKCINLAKLLLGKNFNVIIVSTVSDNKFQKYAEIESNMTFSELKDEFKIEKDQDSTPF